MISWSECSKIQKFLTGVAAALIAVTTIVSSIVLGYSHFMTDAEAAEAHEKINQVIAKNQKDQLRAYNQSRIDNLQSKIDEIDYKMLSEKLSDEQHEFLANKRQEYKETVACIRQGEC